MAKTADFPSLGDGEADGAMPSIWGMAKTLPVEDDVEAAVAPCWVDCPWIDAEAGLEDAGAMLDCEEEPVEAVVEVGAVEALGAERGMLPLREWDADARLCMDATSSS